MKKMGHLRMMLKKLDKLSREYRQLQEKAPNCFDYDAWEGDEERRKAEIKAEKAARDAYRDVEMYLLCITDLYSGDNTTPAEFDAFREKENQVDRELAAIFHQNGGNIDNAVKAVCDCIK